MGTSRRQVNVTSGGGSGIPAAPTTAAQARDDARAARDQARDARDDAQAARDEARDYAAQAKADAETPWYKRW